ncbi:MAG TPA: hypothetical protein PKN32_11935 [Bacteroidales bacterium]|nr:hypothetical protein [Bacteroidales bacterium]
MNILKNVLLIGFLLTISIASFSQVTTENSVVRENDENGSNYVTPVMTNTVKTGGEPSTITQKVIELAVGDNAAAERTVRYLKVERTPPVLKIVSDEEYARLEGKEQESVISESEVIELINQFK